MVHKVELIVVVLSLLKDNKEKLESLMNLEKKVLKERLR